MFKVKGGDQREYGPISAEQVREWVAQNRLNRFSLAERVGESGWRPLGQYPELADIFSRPATPAAPAAPDVLAASSTAPGVGGESAPSTGAAEPSPVPSAAPKPTVTPVVQAGSGSGASIPASPLASADPATYGSYLSATSTSREAAISKVTPPAIGMMILAGISLLWGVVAPFTKAAWMKIFTQMIQNLPGPGVDAQTRRMLAESTAVGAMDIFQSLVLMVAGGFMLAGAIKMSRLQSFPLAMAASILAVFPCCTNCCCLIGIPLGVWGLVVLNQPEVKQHFDRN